jgi:hypothetical protein
MLCASHRPLPLCSIWCYCSSPHERFGNTCRSVLCLSLPFCSPPSHCLLCAANTCFHSSLREGFGIRRQVFVLAFVCGILELIRLAAESSAIEFQGNTGFYLPLILQYLCVQLYVVLSVVMPALSTFTLCEASTTSDGK